MPAAAPRSRSTRDREKRRAPASPAAEKRRPDEAAAEPQSELSLGIATFAAGVRAAAPAASPPPASPPAPPSPPGGGGPGAPAAPADGGGPASPFDGSDRGAGGGARPRSVSHVAARAAPARVVRRACASCGPAPEDEARRATAFVVRRCAACEGALARGDAPPGGCTCGAGKAAALVSEAVGSEGRPLDPGVRAFFESRFGEGLGGVRVHTGDAADRSARAVDALAYTVGSDVVFRAGYFAPGSPSGQRLLAHELAHVVQQGRGGQRALAPTGRLEVGRADDPVEREADRAAAHALSPAAGRPALSADRAPAVRRGWRDSLGAAWDATGGRAVDATVSGARWVGGQAVAGAQWVGDRAGEAVDAAREALGALAERLAPGLIRFLRGDVVGMIRDRIGTAIASLFGSLGDRVRREGLAGALQGVVGEAAGAVARVAGELSRGDCTSVLAAARAVYSFVSTLVGPLVDQVRSGARSVAGFLSDVWTRFGKPAWEAIKSVAGAAWQWIEDTAARLWEWALPIRNAVAGAWDWVKRQFNLAWDSTAGVLDWLKAKAAAAWDSIMETVRPILGPLRVVGTVLVALSPLGPMIAAGYAATQLWRGLVWLWNNWDTGRVVAYARELLHGTILPAVMSGVEALRGALETALGWFTGVLWQVAGAFDALLGALGVSGFLRALHALVDMAASLFRRLAAWAATTLTAAVRGAGRILRTVWEYLRPVLELTAKLIFLAVNPWLLPIVTAGIAWRVLPECLKGPIIDWVLDVMVAVVEALPEWELFGEAWPQAKRAILDALRQARGLPTGEKVAMSNRVARMMTGEDLSWIVSLIRGAIAMPEHFESQIQEELIGMDLTRPLPFERGAAPAPAQLVQAATLQSGATALSPADAAVLARPRLTAADVGVDSVGALQLEPELLRELGLAADGEVVFGENPDPSASIDAIRAELSDAPPENAAGTAPADAPADAATSGDAGADGTAATAPGAELPAATATAAPPAGATAADAAPAPAGDASAAPAGDAAAAPAPAGPAGHADGAPADTEAQLQAMMAQPGPTTCGPPAPQHGPATSGDIPESMRIGPLTQGQRARYMMDQMWKGIRHWFRCNARWLVPALILAAVALIVLEIVTGGAVTAALPVIFEVLGTIMIGVAVLRGAWYVGEYVVRAIAGDVAGAARALARAIAVAVVEAVFALIFEAAVLLKYVRDAARAVARGAARGARAVGRGARSAVQATATGARRVGRAVASTRAGGRVLAAGGRMANAAAGGVRRTVGAVLRNGRIILEGVGGAIGRGIRSLRDLARRLWRRLRFRRFKIRRAGRRIQLWGYLNPWLLMADGTIENVTGPRAQLGDPMTLGRRQGYIVGILDSAGTSGSAYVRSLDELTEAELRAIWRRMRDAPNDAARRAIVLEARATGENARLLRAEMTAAGHVASPGDAAHHIIPSTHRLGDDARRVLDDLGIGINDARNGVFVSQALHAPLHTKAYMAEVQRRILQASGSATSRAARIAAVQQELANIAKLIKAGNFP